MKNTNFCKPLSQLITMVAICMLSLHAMAYDFSYTYQGKTLYYNITSDNTVEVTYHSSDNYFQNNNYVSGDVVIPSSVTNNDTTYSVTSIGEMAFYHCSGLTSVTIPNSVTSIGGSAFYKCSGLTSVTIPNGVTSISGGAFVGCSSLTSVTIPNSVTSIGNYAFGGCSGLTSVTIPNSVTSIGGAAFSECSGLTSVTIPNSVTSIGEGAFYECSELTSVTIPNSVTSIGDRAFYECSELTSVTIGNSVTSIGEEAFYECSGLTSVTIGNSVTSIGEGAFYECIGLTSVTIPNSVTSIAGYAFYECNGLTSIISNAVVPPALGNKVFPKPNSCNVIVPCGTLEDYTAPTCYWNAFFNDRIEEDCDVSLQEVESAREFVVYPNPASGKVVFDKAVERVEVIDLVGKTIQTYENASEINIGALPAGVYHLRMSLEDQTITRMVIKE